MCRPGTAERRAANASAGLEQVTVGIAALTCDGADTGGACAAAAGTGAALRAAAGILRSVLAAVSCVLLAAWAGAGLAAGTAAFLPGTLTEVVAAGLKLISLQREQGRSGDLQMHARRQDEIGSQREGNRIRAALTARFCDGQCWIHQDTTGIEVKEQRRRNTVGLAWDLDTVHGEIAAAIDDEREEPGTVVSGLECELEITGLLTVRDGAL